jgi:hypothetical protein
VVLAHGHHIAESVILLAFKILAGATGTVVIGILVMIVLPIGWLYKRSASSEFRHAALRGNRRRVALERLTGWASARARGTAIFVAGIAFVAMVHDGFLPGFHLAVGALWFYALATFVESVSRGDRKFVRYSTGISLGYLLGITFAPHLHHL